MTIKEVSEKYGISQDTLRYYERVGMIPPVTRTAGGIRDYKEKRFSLGRACKMYAQRRTSGGGDD